MNFVFYVNHDSELFLFENLIKVFRRKQKTKIIALLPNNEKRIKTEKYSFFDQIQKISSLEYTKNIFSLLKNYYELKNQIKNLFDEQDFTFISFEPYSLNSIFLLSYFKKNKSIILSTNQLNSIDRDRKINISKTILYSICSFLVSKKTLKYFDRKGTFYHSIDVKINSDYYIVFKNTDFKNSIIAQDKIKIKNHPALYFRNLTDKKKKIHILLITLVNGLMTDEYMNFINEIIYYFKENNIQFLVKDHPSSIYSDIELIRKLRLNKNEHLEKNIHIENYFMKNFSTIKCIYGPNTTALRSAYFLGLNNICYQLIFEKKEEYNKLIRAYFDASGTLVVTNFTELTRHIKLIDNNTNTYKKSEVKYDDYDFLFT